MGPGYLEGIITMTIWVTPGNGISSSLAVSTRIWQFPRFQRILLDFNRVCIVLGFCYMPMDFGCVLYILRVLVTFSSFWRFFKILGSFY